MMSNNKVKLQKALMLCCLIKEYYQIDSSGGCVHIVLDDGNYGKNFVEHCLKFAIEKKDFWGETISTLLLGFTDEEQEQIIERSWEIKEQIK